MGKQPIPELSNDMKYVGDLVYAKGCFKRSRDKAIFDDPKYVNMLNENIEFCNQEIARIKRWWDNEKNKRDIF